MRTFGDEQVHRDAWIETHIRARAREDGTARLRGCACRFQQLSGARVDIDLVAASLAEGDVRFCVSGCC
jgi:hypothetical protein